jgi:hypothetical protein
LDKQISEIETSKSSPLVCQKGIFNIIYGRGIPIARFGFEILKV